jgi:DHA1 family tetracycline resistance protein-like MFS transporter
VQPWAGRARDTGRLRDRPGMSIGLGVAALGLLAGGVIPGVAGSLVAAVLIGAGTGLVTPVAFAHLAGTTPTARLGQTMGAAEVGRELGDAGGPLLVGAVGAVLTVNWGLTALALVLTVTVATTLAARPARNRNPCAER